VAIERWGKGAPYSRKPPKVFPHVPRRAGVSFLFHLHPIMAVLKQSGTSMLRKSSWQGRPVEPHENRCAGQGGLIFLEVFLSVQEASTKALITSSSRVHFLMGIIAPG